MDREERTTARRERHAVLFATVLAKRESFALMIDASTKHVDRLVAQGLPTVGKGKALRIDVERAVAWLREQNAQQAAAVVDDDEQAGRTAARRNAERRAKR